MPYYGSYAARLYHEDNTATKTMVALDPGSVREADNPYAYVQLMRKESVYHLDPSHSRLRVAPTPPLMAVHGTHLTHEALTGLSLQDEDLRHALADGREVTPTEFAALPAEDRVGAVRRYYTGLHTADSEAFWATMEEHIAYAYERPERHRLYRRMANPELPASPDVLWGRDLRHWLDEQATRAIVRSKDYTALLAHDTPIKNDAQFTGPALVVKAGSPTYKLLSLVNGNKVPSDDTYHPQSLMDIVDITKDVGSEWTLPAGASINLWNFGGGSLIVDHVAPATDLNVTEGKHTITNSGSNTLTFQLVWTPTAS